MMKRYLAQCLFFLLFSQSLFANTFKDEYKEIPPQTVLDNENTNEPPEKYNKTLKILSWNIYMLPYFIFRKSKKAKRAREIVRLLNESDYDILLLQEAFKHRPRRIIRKGLQEKYPYQFAKVNHKAMSLRTNSGLLVLSNRPLIEKGTLEFDECHSWDCMARKGAILLQGEHHGHRFQVAVTHANTGPHTIKSHQYNMIYDQLLRPNQEEGVPQIMAGDMNCGLSQKDNYEAMLRLFDAEDTPLTGERRHSNWEQTEIIDYILLRRNNSTVKQVQKNITLVGPDWSPEGVKNRNKGAIGLSDHYPLDIELSFE